MKDSWFLHLHWRIFTFKYWCSLMSLIICFVVAIYIGRCSSWILTSLRNFISDVNWCVIIFIR